MLRLEHVDVAYGSTQVLWDININLAEKEILSIVGSNGAGKTTIARVLSGLIPIMKGRVFFEESDITNFPSEKILELGIAQVPEGRQLFRGMTVYENLELGAFNKRCKAEMKTSLARVYEWFPRIEERKNQMADTLSGGEQQMLAISRSYMSLPRLLIFDEPSLGLAPNIVDQIMTVVKTLRSEGITVILIEQDVRKALKVSDRGYVLENGIIRLEGTAKELSENSEVKKAYLGF